MTQTPIRVEFNNRFYPTAQFDLVEIGEAFTRKSLDHSMEEPHVVDFYTILFFLRGEGTHTVDFTDFDYQAGTILTIRKDQIHKYKKNREVRGYMLLFTEQFVTSFFDEKESQRIIQVFNELLGSPKVQLSDSDFIDFSGILDRMKTEYFTNQDEYSLGIIRSELQILIAKLDRIKKYNQQVISDRKYLQEFVQFQKMVEENVKQNSKVSHYAQEMGYSTKTLNAITQSILNKSAKSFIDDIYIKQIKRLLLNTNYPIKEIAYETGFEETTNFYKYFKKQVQLTPEQFRLQYE